MLRKTPYQSPPGPCFADMWGKFNMAGNRSIPDVSKEQFQVMPTVRKILTQSTADMGIAPPLGRWNLTQGEATLLPNHGLETAN